MNSRLFRRYLRYYATIFLVPTILLGFLLYFVVLENLKSEIRQNTYEDLVLAGLSMDEQIDQMLTTAGVLQASSFFGRYAYDRDPNRSRELINMLNVFVSLNPIITTTVVHFDDQPFLFSETTTITRSFLGSYIDAFVPLAEQDRSRLIDSILNTQRSQILGPLVTTEADGRQGSMVVYLFPIERNGLRIGSAGFFLASDFLIEVIGDDEDRTSKSLFVLTDNDAAVFEYAPIESMRAEAVLEAADGGDATSRQGMPLVLDGTEYYLHRVPSRHGLSYASLTPVGLANQSLRPITLLLRIIGILLALLGVGTSVFLSRKTYEPIRNLRRISESISGETAAGGEIMLIEDTLTRLVSENSSLSKRGATFDQMNKRDLVFRLIKGTFVADSVVEERGTELGFLRDGFIYAAGIVRTQSRLGKDQRMAVAAVEAEVRDVLDANVLFREAVDESAFQLIISIRDQELGVEFVSGLKSHIEEYLGPLTLALGSFCPRWHDLARSFVEAQISLDYSYINDSGSVLYYPAIRQVKSFDDRYYSPSRLYVIRQHVRRLDQEGFEQSLQMLREEAESNLHHLHLAKALAFDLKNTFYLGVMDLEKLYRVPAGILREIESLREEETFAAFCSRLVGLLSRLRAVCADPGSGGSPAADHPHEYVSYLRIRFRDPNISLESVAEHFGMSAAGFSRSFKKTVHMGFLEYLSFLRIDDGKRRLTEPNASVAAVALDVGYQNAATFIRRFRQLEGITPGKFQRLLGQNPTDGER